jgi:hypothetical protein
LVTPFSNALFLFRKAVECIAFNGFFTSGVSGFLKSECLKRRIQSRVSGIGILRDQYIKLSFRPNAVGGEICFSLNANSKADSSTTLGMTSANVPHAVKNGVPEKRMPETPRQ